MRITVGDVRKAIEGLSDDTEVVIEVERNDGDDLDQLAADSVQVEHRCSDRAAVFFWCPEDQEGLFDDDEVIDPMEEKTDG